MSKKDKKIEIQIKDAKVIVNKATIEGFELLVGKKVIGQIVEPWATHVLQWPLTEGSKTARWSKTPKMVPVQIVGCNSPI